MKPVLLATTFFALVAVAACNRQESAGANDSAVPRSAIPSETPSDPAGSVPVEQAYEIRHERYEDMGDSFKAINRELKGGAPDVAVIQREAAAMAALAPQIPGWFPAGSGPDVHAKSRAKAEIWSDPEGFRVAHADFLAQVQRFKQAADSGDVGAIGAAAPELGRTCGGCHDKFRGKER